VVSDAGVDRATIEREYVDDLLSHLREHGSENSLRLLSHAVRDSWPDTELDLVVVFDWSATPYGLRDRI